VNTRSSRPKAALWLRLAWALGLLAAITLLVYGTVASSPVRSNQERVQIIAATVKCPVCAGQSAAVSDAPAARVIRVEIGRQVQIGQSDEQIRAFLAARYGDSIILTPPATGVDGLVWVIPVVGVALGIVLIALAFSRWRREAELEVPTDADRAIVDRVRTVEHDATLGEAP
jgi:cytochrome c-type biogenesis protein CcmH